MHNNHVYNLTAKILRERMIVLMRYAEFDDNALFSGVTMQIRLMLRREIELLAVRFASSFIKNDPQFDAIKWLNSCSPNPDIYDFGELWNEN